MWVSGSVVSTVASQQESAEGLNLLASWIPAVRSVHARTVSVWVST